VVAVTGTLGVVVAVDGVAGAVVAVTGTLGVVVTVTVVPGEAVAAGVVAETVGLVVIVPAKESIVEGLAPGGGVISLRPGIDPAATSGVVPGNKLIIREIIINQFRMLDFTSEISMGLDVG